MGIRQRPLIYVYHLHINLWLKHEVTFPTYNEDIESNNFKRKGMQSSTELTKAVLKKPLGLGKSN